MSTTTAASAGATTAGIVRKVVDVVVIGAGSGGLEAAWNTATELKKTVAVIDAQKEHGPPFYAALGGTCVNVGCVPKKLFAISANFRETCRDAKGFGYQVDTHSVKHSWQTLLEQKNKTISNINKSYGDMFADTKGMSFHMGWGRFADKKLIEVIDSQDGKTVKEIIEAKEAVLIATGSWPSFPNTPGLKEYGVSSNEIFYLKKIPKRVLVVGGGYIACELTSILRSFADEDAKIVLSYRSALFLRGFDEDLRKALAEQMRARDIDVRFNSNVKQIELHSNGETRVVTFLEDEKPEEFDLVLCATGRHPNTERLQLDKAGLKTGRGGAITVDKFSKTEVEGIFAIGDVTDRLMLTPVAIHEAQCFSDTISGNPRAPDHANVPCAVFTIPQLGVVGLTEEEAAKKHKTIAVYVTKSTPLMHQLTGNSWKKAVLKMITDHSNGKVLGFHICAPEAGEMIQGLGIAVKAGVTHKDVVGTIGVHPTICEDMCSLRVPDYFYVEGKRQEKLQSSL